ncbi:hypothetical protein TL16_g00843 [Triparma laevis f. inornata]|uniref:C-CAP/cofactor C-like domain-containing protein n=1 Tax=Triparma laevis f. inornata TaxID=1714386 RepID=A0A9W7DQK7_9STRA|nr:hypothetical protein TL16_g00843 [Triparma laevis f. inornata]
MQDNSSSSESTPAFLSAFNSTYQSTLADLDGIPQTVAVTAKARQSVESVLSDAIGNAADLREKTAASSHFLNPYDVRSSEQKVDELLRKIEAIKRVVVPRKKFVFQSRRSGSDRSSDFFNKESKPSAISLGNSQRQEHDDSNAQVNYSTEYSNMKGKNDIVVHVVPPVGYNMKDMRLKDIEDSVFVLLDVYGAVRLQNLKNCTIYLGCILGPLYVENVRSCKIFAMGRQLRIHDTYEVDFYVHMCSGPIIEKCDGLRFGEYCIDFEAKEEMVKTAGLLEVNNGNNMYNDVQDFKWLKKMKSPHFDLLDVSDGEGGAVDRSESEIVKVTTKAGILREEKEEKEKKEKKKKKEEEARRNKGGEGGEVEVEVQEEEDSEDEL